MRLRLHGHLVHGAIRKVDELLGVAEREAPVAARANVPGVGRRGRVAPRRSALASERPGARYEIAPAHPPLPTAWNLPFQPDAGIQTSILMSESLDGFSVAGDAAERRQVAEGRRCGRRHGRTASRRGRREGTGSDRLRQRDCRVG